MQQTTGHDPLVVAYLGRIANSRLITSPVRTIASGVALGAVYASALFLLLWLVPPLLAALDLAISSARSGP